MDSERNGTPAGAGQPQDGGPVADRVREERLRDQNLRNDVLPGDPGFRARGPAQGEEAGVIDEDEPQPDEAGFADVADPPPALPGSSGHVSAGIDWVPDDEDDPDSGSGRTGAGDGGYMPGEATGRPYRR